MSRAEYHPVAWLACVAALGGAAMPRFCAVLRGCRAVWRDVASGTTPMVPPDFTVLIADPNPMSRAGLRAWLGATATTIEASDLLGALRALKDPAVNVAVVDARLGGPGTAEARDGLRALARRAPVVVMGMAGDPAPYEVAVLAGGGAGYWRKDGDVGELVQLLRASARSARELSGPRLPS